MADYAFANPPYGLPCDGGPATRRSKVGGWLCRNGIVNFSMPQSSNAICFS